VALGHTNAHRDPEPGVVHSERWLHRVENSRGDVDCIRTGTGVIHHHDRELVAAETGDEILTSHAGVQATGELHEQRVTAFVTQRVVHVLEVVDIDEEDTLAPRHTVDARCEGRCQAFCQRRSIRQAGQRVSCGAQRQGHVTLVKRPGHVVECLGEVAQLVATGRRDAVRVIAGLQLQDALVQTRYRPDEVLAHAPPEIRSHGQRQAEQGQQNDDQASLEAGVPIEAVIHRLQRRGFDTCQQRLRVVARRAEGPIVVYVGAVNRSHFVAPQAVRHQPVPP
jgi:hypothetical protein